MHPTRCLNRGGIEDRRRRTMKKGIRTFTWIMVLGLTLLFAMQVFAAQGGAPTASQSAVGSEGPEVTGIEPQNIAPWMGMREEWRRFPRTLAGRIYLWERYITEHRHDLGLTLNQQDEIGSWLRDQRKKWVQKRADRIVLFMDVEDLLLKEPLDVKKVEEKVKAIQALSAEMFMDQIRTLEKVLSILTPEQRKTVEDFMRESTFSPGVGAY
jgi:Spy/CpxP family protein refolding chaperone